VEGFGYACALLLAAVFVRAAAAKVARPAQTAVTFAALGVPGAAATARAVPIVELVVAGALLAASSVGAIAALLVLVGFTALLSKAVLSGLQTPCNCFGAARAEPVSWSDVARNVMLAGLAALALRASGPVLPRPAAAVAAAALFAGGYGVLAALRARRSTT
jgi:hypothetical protein